MLAQSERLHNLPADGASGTNNDNLHAPHLSMLLNLVAAGNHRRYHHSCSFFGGKDFACVSWLLIVYPLTATRPVQRSGQRAAKMQRSARPNRNLQ